MMEEEKIVSIEERIPKLKEKRRKKSNRTLLIYLTLFFFLIAIIVYLQSPFSNINTIAVEGNEVIPKEQIVKYSELSLDTNMWRLSTKNTEKLIHEHTIVEDVKVDRKFPQTIHISVSEKKVIGYAKHESELHPILEEGVVLNNVEVSLPRGAPLFESFTEEEYLQRFAEELVELPDHILNLISEVHWQPTEQNQYKIVLYMNDGFIVNATIRDFASKMKSYPSIIAQLEAEEKGIIHMDVGVYVETFKKK